MDRNDAERTLRKHLAYFDNDATGRPATIFIVDAMIEFTTAEVKKLNKADVMQQSEQLKAFLTELTLPDTRNFVYIQDKAKELLKSL